MWFLHDGTGYSLLFGPWRTEADKGLDQCPRILLSCIRARTSAGYSVAVLPSWFAGLPSCKIEDLNREIAQCVEDGLNK